LGFGLEDRGKNAVDFFLTHNLKGPFYNSFDFGSYLAYRLYPQEKIFVDGRAQAYPKSFFKTIYFPLQQDPKQFYLIQYKYLFNTIFMAHWDQTPQMDKFLLFILKNPTYQLVYLDDYALIFVKKRVHDKDLLQRYKITENTFQLPSNLSEEKLVRYVFLFEKLKWKSQEKKAYAALLKQDQNAYLLKSTLNFLNPKLQMLSLPLVH